MAKNRFLDKTLKKQLKTSPEPKPQKSPEPRIMTIEERREYFKKLRPRPV